MKTFIVAVLLMAICVTGPALANPTYKPQPKPQPKPTPKPAPKPNTGIPGFNIPGFGNIPGLGNPFGGGFGFGYSGPNGGYAKGGTYIPTTVCKEKGPCFNKKLTCPAKCFQSYSRVGKGYAGGGGGGGCTFNCKKCVAYC